MSGGIAVKAGERRRGITRLHDQREEDGDTAGHRPQGLALTAGGPQAPNNKGKAALGCPAHFARGIVIGWRQTPERRLRERSE